MIGKVTFLKTLKSILFSVLIFGSCFFSAIYLADFFSRTFMCGNSFEDRITSPNGKYQAVTFLRDCGATTAFTPQVSILPVGAKLPHQNGNVFVGSYGATFTKAKWISDTHLVIKYRLYNKGSPTLMVTTKYDILIEYQVVKGGQ